MTRTLYDPSEMHLAQARKRAKELTFKFNHLPPEEAEQKKNIIKQLFGSTTDNFHIEQTFQCDYGYNIQIGNNFYANHNLVILDCAPVVIGDNVFIAPNVGIYTAGHPISPKIRNSGLEYALPIKIGNNVWIGGNVVILPGVTIGDNTTIGAGSVVTTDIANNCVAVGNPCIKIKNITDFE